METLRHESKEWAWAVFVVLLGLLLTMAAYSFIFAAQPPGKGGGKVKFKGKADVIVIDRDDGKAEHKWFIKHDGKRHELKFKKHPGNLQTDADIEVDGIESLDGESIDVEVMQLNQILPNTFGLQKTAVILVNFKDNSGQPYTLDLAKSVLRSVSLWDRDVSFNQAWLADAGGVADQVDVFGWYPIDAVGSDCANNYYRISSLADLAAQAAGIDLSPYRHKVYGFPNSSCGYWGLGNVGGNPSHAWINGSFELPVVAHEMGHNFGLQHSHSICAPGCTLVEYGDTWDVMGNARGEGHFHAFQKERLGWLDYGASPTITTVTISGQYRIGAYETQVSESKALKIFKGTNASGQRLNYYVEYRAAVGADSKLYKAVLVHVGNESDRYDNNLWDLDQATSVADWTLDVGQTYSDQAAQVSFSLVSWTNSEAVLNVALGSGTVLAAPSGLSVK